jgi:hypothetical protein
MRPVQDFSDLDQDKFNLAYDAFKGKIRTFARNAVHTIPGMDNRGHPAGVVLRAHALRS